MTKIVRLIIQSLGISLQYFMMGYLIKRPCHAVCCCSIYYPRVWFFNQPL